MTTQQLLRSLAETTNTLIERAQKFQHLSDKQLNRRTSNDSWSILECLEHLNLYGDYYLPEIGKAIKNANSKPVSIYKAGWLGNYFANSMLPKEKLNKMKTFKDKNPVHSNLDGSTIERFVAQQNRMLELLTRSENVNINKIKIKTSISSLIRLKLGDTLRFVINHNIRHIAQAEKIIR